MEIVDAVDTYKQYVLVEKGLSRQTWSSYLEDIQAFFNHFQDKKTTDDLEETDLYEILKYELAIGHSVSTALRRLSCMRNFFLFLKRDGYYQGTIPDIEAPKKPKYLPNCLTEDEVEALYPHEVILLAAHECGLTGSPPEKVLELLKAWKEKGFSTEEEIRDYIRAFHEQTSLLQELSQIWGGRERLGKKEREYATRWKEMGMSRELILTAAEFASEAKSPMAYLNSILMAMKDKGITTPDEARRERESSSRKPGEKPAAGSKTVRAQEYSQRDYAGRQEKARARFEQMSGGDEEDA